MGRVHQRAGNLRRRVRAAQTGDDDMATRERRLAEFDGAGAPPPGEPVQVLCEDQSGTYQLPFVCHYLNGQWRNHESGGALEATVIGWRMPRVEHSHNGHR